MWFVFFLILLCFIVPGGAITVFFGLLVLTPELILVYVLYCIIRRFMELH